MTAPPAGALEACPFCGGEAELRGKTQQRYVACLTNRCVDGPYGDFDDDAAIAAWNRRTDATALRLREGWRPVLTMPKDGGTYLVTNRLGEVCPLLDGVIQNNTGRQDWTWGNPVIAWQPMPAPPAADDLARILEEGE